MEVKETNSTMSKNILSLIIIILFFSHSYSQEELTISTLSKHKLIVNISDGSPFKIAISINESSIPSYILGYDLSTYESFGNKRLRTPNFGLGYRYNINDFIAFGIDFGYQYSSTSTNYIPQSSTSSNPIIYRNRKGHFVLIMPTVDITFVNQQLLKLYARGSIGASIYGFDRKFRTANDSSVDHYRKFGFLPAFQITPFGIEVGKRVAGFFELGFGFRGFVTFGLSVDL